MRKTLGALALAYFLAPAPASSQLQNCDVVPRPTRVVSPRLAQSRPNLVVNTSEDFRYLTTKPRLEGIGDVVRLVFESDLPEAWIFLSESNRWFEYGRREGVCADDDGLPYTFLQTEVVGIEAQLDGDAEVYRSRPALTWDFREFANNMADSLPENSTIPRSTAVDMYFNHFKAVMGLPNGSVLREMMVNQILNAGNDVAFSSTIISDVGMVTFALTEEGLDSFDGISDPRLEEYITAYAGRVGQLSGVSPELYLDPPQEQLRRFTDVLSDGEVSFKYDPVLVIGR